MAIYVNNLQAKTVISEEDESRLKALAQAALDQLGRGDAEAGITLAGDSYLKELNRDYRGCDEPTDVLSFALVEQGEGEPRHEEPGPELLGDIIISTERARIQAEQGGHSFRRELAHLTLHGLLHLLGYDHDRPERAAEMRAAEEAILYRQRL